MFDLLKLPPELRIKIYEYALVRDVIRIVCTIHPFGALHPSRYDEAQRNQHQLWYERPVSLRSRKTRLANVKFVAGNLVGDEISYSYGIQPDHFPPVLNIFLTNRQVYSEAWPIFYQQNAFAFTIPLESIRSAEACRMFLYDRPHHALRHIRELHLLVGNCQQHPVRFKLSSESWQKLLEEISRYMSLRVLVLYVRGRTDKALEYRLPDLPWKEWLCQIKGLQELHIDLIGDSSNEENIAFVQYMRSKMVVGGETGTDGFLLDKRPIFTDYWIKWPARSSLRTTSKYPDMERGYCYD